MALAAHDDVVVNCQPQPLSGVNDPPGHLDVGEGRVRIARWMVVDQHDGRSAQLERALDDLAGVDGRMVYGAFLLNLVGNQLVLLVEEEDAELFVVAEGHGGAHIVEDGVPGAEHRTVQHLAAHQPHGGGMDDLDFGGHGLAHAVHFHQALWLGAQHLGEGAEAGEQLLGDGLGVAAPDGAKQQHLEKLVIRHGIGAGLAEAFLQPFAMPQEVRQRLVARVLEPRHRIKPCRAGS